MCRLSESRRAENHGEKMIMSEGHLPRLMMMTGPRAPTECSVSNEDVFKTVSKPGGARICIMTLYAPR